MKCSRRAFLHLAAGVAGLPAVSPTAWAQAYPTRPVRIIVASTPGGAPDIVARLMGPWLSERLGQQFVVENQPGAGGLSALNRLYAAPPDGLQLMLISGIASTVPVTSRSEYSFRSAGASPEPAAQITAPTCSSWSSISALVTDARQPGMDSSLSSVPPV